MAQQIIVTYGGTEWASDPVAWYGDPDYYLPYIENARKIMEGHPSIDMVRVGCVGDVGWFLDTTTDFDMSVVGEFEGEMVYVREKWDVTWVFEGLYVRAHCTTLQWYSKYGNVQKRQAP